MKSREQLLYAQSRLEAEFQKKQDKLRASFTKTVAPPLLSDVVAGIKSGKYKLSKDFSKDRPLHRCDTISSVFGIIAGETNLDRKGFNDAIRVLEEARQRAMDAIMLGEASEALKVIDAFAKG